MELTRPTFVVTDREAGLPLRSRDEVRAVARRLPSRPSVFTLAKLAQWRAAEPHREPRAELAGLPSAFLSQACFERVRYTMAQGRHGLVHRYASILGLTRLMVADGAPSSAADSREADVESLGELLLALNRLLEGGLPTTLDVPRGPARRMWLGEQAIAVREYQGSTPVFGWQVGASVFQRLVEHRHFGILDQALRRSGRPSLSGLFGGLAMWLGHSATGDGGPHLYELPSLDKHDRTAAWLARRLAIRRKDGDALLRGWSASPASTRLRDTPFFVHRGTAVCADPLALGDLAGLRFGRLVDIALDGLTLNRSEQRARSRWSETWNKVGLESWLRAELKRVADAGEEPRERDDQQRCDAVVRFGQTVLFVETKLTYPQPSILRMRDREKVYRDLLERFASRRGDGLSQVLSTMRIAARDPSYLPGVAPDYNDDWWPVIVTAESIPFTREWRTEWRDAARSLPGPGVKPYRDPVFLSLPDACWLIELARRGDDVGASLDDFMASGHLTFGSYASRRVRSGLPPWLSTRAEDLFQWLSDQLPS